MSETYTQITDSNECTFNINDGTWTVAITQPARYSMALPCSVDDRRNCHLLTYGAVSIPASDVGKRTVYYTCLDNDITPSKHYGLRKMHQSARRWTGNHGNQQIHNKQQHRRSQLYQLHHRRYIRVLHGGGRKINATIPPGTSP